MSGGAPGLRSRLLRAARPRRPRPEPALPPRARAGDPRHRQDAVPRAPQARPNVRGRGARWAGPGVSNDGVRDAPPFQGSGRARAPSEHQAPVGTSPRLGEESLPAPTPFLSEPELISMLAPCPSSFRGALATPIHPFPGAWGGGGVGAGTVVSAAPSTAGTQSQKPRRSFFHPHPRPALNRSQTGFGQHGSEEWGQSGGFPAGSPSCPGPRPGEYAAGGRGGRWESGTARRGSGQNWGAGWGGTLQKADQTVPSASHPFLDPPPEAARAGVSVPEAGTEARAGLRGKLPGSGCITCWGCWSTPPGTSQTMLLRVQVWGPS